LLQILLLKVLWLLLAVALVFGGAPLQLVVGLRLLAQLVVLSVQRLGL